MAWQHVDHLTALRAQRPTVLAIGSFDGVHLGHQHLLQQVVAAARAADAQAAVLTFFPHPREVIQGLSGRLYLTLPAERAQLIAAQGIDLVITHPFDAGVRMQRAADFVQQLVDHLALRQLWGGSFSLGYRREGDFDYLTHLGTQHGFSVHRVPPLLQADGTHISSSGIRAALAVGNVGEVASWLGRPYRVSGEVVRGRQLGRTIGFPTANVFGWERQILPANGVYATLVWHNGQAWPAATNVGVRPTIAGDAALTVEAHLLDFDGDLYGAPLAIDFITHIRPEQKFSGLDALKAQIATDVLTTRAILATA